MSLNALITVSAACVCVCLHVCLAEDESMREKSRRVAQGFEKCTGVNSQLTGVGAGVAPLHTCSKLFNN